MSVADDHPHAELGALGVIEREIARGDLRPDADVDMATHLPVGPVHFRLMFRGYLSQDFANRVIDNVRARLRGVDTMELIVQGSGEL